MRTQSKSTRKYRLKLRRAIHWEKYQIPWATPEELAHHVGYMYGKLFRALENVRTEQEERPIPGRLETIVRRIQEGDVSNADHDRFWLVKYIEDHILVPKQYAHTVHGVHVNLRTNVKGPKP